MTNQTEMSPEILAALLSSIAKWERNLEHARSGNFEEMRIYGDTCALCEISGINYLDGPNCVLCPVMQNTGLPQCRGTPWGGVVSALWDVVVCGEGDVIAATQAEVDFLRSLLPTKTAAVAE